MGLILEYNQKSNQLEIIPQEKEMTKAEKVQVYLIEGIKESPLPQKIRDRLQHYLQVQNKVVD